MYSARGSVDIYKKLKSLTIKEINTNTIQGIQGETGRDNAVLSFWLCVEESCYHVAYA